MSLYTHPYKHIRNVHIHTYTHSKYTFIWIPFLCKSLWKYNNCSVKSDNMSNMMSVTSLLEEIMWAGTSFCLRFWISSLETLWFPALFQMCLCEFYSQMFRCENWHIEMFNFRFRFICILKGNTANNDVCVFCGNPVHSCFYIINTSGFIKQKSSCVHWIPLNI